MAETTFTVEIAADQFTELSKPSQPLAAVLELIWNGLDAEADTVTVAIGRTPLDAVDSMKVVDDGHGMSHDVAVQEFRQLGGSWKASSKLSQSGKRSLHGKKGQGRFRAFALGEVASWSTVAEGVGSLERTVITGRLDSNQFQVDGPDAMATGTPGTEVSISRPREASSQLLGDRAIPFMLVRLAAYLARYPDVSVTYDGERLDLDAVLKGQTTITLAQHLGGDHEAPVLRLLEWQPDIVHFEPLMLLCDAHGVVLHEIRDLADTGRRKVTAYLSWSGFDEHADTLELAEMGDPVLGPIVGSARLAISDYLSERERAERVEQIEAWKSARVYPFASPPATPTERTERAVFDAVAATAAVAVPSDPRSARLSLRLIREALEQSPGALHRVLTDVLDLTPDQLAVFDSVLKTTSLPSIISATAAVTDRLRFLTDLEQLLFSEDGKATVLERMHLHTILENDRTWIFGEEYSLVVSERSLRRVLQTHLALLGKDTPVLGPVTDERGKTGRVDLMLSRTANGPNGRRHLVVELKRPSVILGADELVQITRYAVAVTRDAAFRADDVTWDFWLVGDDYDDYISEAVHSDGLPAGVAQQKHPYTIRVRRWADVLEENRQRLHFYRDRLSYEPEEEQSIRETLTRLLPTHQTSD